MNTCPDHSEPDSGKGLTDSGRVEEALSESEERYKMFIALSAEGIVRIDFNPPILTSLPVSEQLAAIVSTGVVAECNDAAACVRGWSTARDLLGKRVGDLNQSSDPVNRLNFSQFIESGYSIVDGVTLGRDARGKDRWFLNNAVGVVRDGFLRHIWTVQRDMTDRVRAETALREAQAQALSASKDFTHRLISAQDQERKRLANELHDSLGQSLSLIKNRADLALALPGLTGETSAHLQAINEVVISAIEEVRSLARNLRPLRIDQLGLTDALEQLLDRFAQASGLTIERRLENLDLFRGEEATHVYRIMQEVLNNVLKHANATRVRVTVERDLLCARLMIVDDGRGFDASGLGSRPERNGIGLTSIAERVLMLAGSLEITSAPGKGTKVSIELPLGENEPPVD